MWTRLVQCTGVFALVAAAHAPLVAHAQQSESFANLGDDSYRSNVGEVYTASDVSGEQQQQPMAHIQKRIRAGEVPVRGVNLGGWLVSEHWMTTEASFWHGVDEEVASGGEFQVLTKGADPDTRRAEFDNHHATFVTEQDIKDIADAGLNTVRVPIGYWIVGDDPFDPSGREDWRKYPNGTVEYVDRLIKDWAVKHDVAVLLSIHAAKGSQNGADHSAPAATGECYWSKFPENVDNTVNVAKFLGDRYKDEPAFLGIGLLNEPNGDTDESVLNQYYLDAYAAVRESGNDCILTIMPLLYKQDVDNLVGFMEAPTYMNVWVEWHPYFIWGYADQSPDEIVSQSIKTNFNDKVHEWVSRPNANKMFFGEWSLANTGQFPDPNTAEYENWAEAQTSVMDAASGGWTYWSWRVYGDETGFNGWSMRSVLRIDAVKKIVVPQRMNTMESEGTVASDATESASVKDTLPPQKQEENHIQQRIRAGEVPVRGVNLGGWLVSEHWMTTEASFWHGVDEEVASGGEFQVLTKGADPDTRRAEFDNHHATFVTEQDIKDIADAGLNTVRVPIGYWIVGDDPFDPSGREDWRKYPNGTVEYVDRLIKDWAVKHDVAVLLSIHAAKGSQNGADHSAPAATGECYWSKFPENVDNTVNVAKFLGDRYKDEPAFLGIGLLNEPNGDTDESVLNQYYLDAYAAVRESGNDCILTIMPLLYKQDVDNLVGFMEAPTYMNVWVEWHPYFIWGYADQSPDEIVSQSIKTNFNDKVHEWVSRPNANKMFFGEWSLANTGQFPDPNTAEYENWAEAQTSVMDAASGGWTYWSWRVYGDETGFNGWSMRSVLRNEKLLKIVVQH